MYAESPLLYNIVPVCVEREKKMAIRLSIDVLSIIDEQLYYDDLI